MERFAKQNQSGEKRVVAEIFGVVFGERMRERMRELNGRLRKRKNKSPEFFFGGRECENSLTYKTIF